MPISKEATWNVPQDWLFLAALLFLSNTYYRLFVEIDYLLAVVWFVAGMLMLLRARQLSPIHNRIVRFGFWIVSIIVLVIIWLPISPSAFWSRLMH